MLKRPLTRSNELSYLLRCQHFKCSQVNFYLYSANSFLRWWLKVLYSCPCAAGITNAVITCSIYPDQLHNDAALALLQGAENANYSILYLILYLIPISVLLEVIETYSEVSIQY